eukprot:64655_1
MALRFSCIYILIILTSFLPSHIEASYDYNNWIKPSSPTLPRRVDHAAVGYDSINNKIWIVGGGLVSECPSCDYKQLISYEIDSNLFTDHGEILLSHSVEGFTAFYTQSGNILYMIDPSGSKLSTFNVNTAQFTYYYQNIDIPHGVNNIGCLASIDDALFVLGKNQNPQFQVMNLTTSTWIVWPEVANRSRSHASCIVHPYNNAFYVIGGYPYTETIEKLYVGDLAHISQYNWEFIESLPHPMSDLRSVVYENDI